MKELRDEEINKKKRKSNKKLREEFENQVSYQGVEKLFKTSNKKYIEWLENKIINKI